MRPREPEGCADFLTALNARPVQTTARGAEPTPVDHLRLDGVEFRPADELRLVTENSLWLLRADTYFRMPKEERFREREWSIEGRLDDCRWHPYRRVWFWIYEGIWLRGRILPVAGPADGVGVYTGCILAIEGSWDEGAHGASAEVCDE